MADLYLETIDRLEPEIHPIDEAIFYASAAISLKRIADSMEAVGANLARIEKILTEPLAATDVGSFGPGTITSDGSDRTIELTRAQIDEITRRGRVFGTPT